MKILYLLNTYPRPSHSFVRREIRALERLGHTVRRMAMRATSDPLVETQDIVEDRLTEHVLGPGATVRLARALLTQMARAPLASLAALRLAMAGAAASGGGRLRHLVYVAEAAHVAALCRAKRIEHVHAHFGTNPAMVAMLVRVMGGPAYSFTVHGPEEFDRPEALMLREKMRRAAFTVAVSAFGRSQLCRWADPADWPRLHVVHCGVEPAAFDDPAPLPGGTGPRLVTVGRMVEQKGQLALIEAMAGLRKRLPGMHLTIVGDGDMRGHLAAAIRGHGLDSRVTLAGWRDEAGVREALDRSHALVLPSFAEGLPMVIMEAMAAARPVIATYVAGIPELVQPGRTGWLVPAGDVDALANALVRLADPALRRQLGQAARESFLAELAPAVSSTSFTRRIRELLGQ